MQSALVPVNRSVRPSPTGGHRQLTAIRPQQTSRGPEGTVCFSVTLSVIPWVLESLQPPAGHPVTLTTAFSAIVTYVRMLAYPPNPRLSLSLPAPPPTHTLQRSEPRNETSYRSRSENQARYGDGHDHGPSLSHSWLGWCLGNRPVLIHLPYKHSFTKK